MQLPSQYEFADICDMAGPCFDNRFRTHRMDYKSAAKNVLCIHTSYNRGTRYTNGCHQNWRLGHCGVYQDAAGSSRTKSHVMCPYFYISSFDNNFCAVPQPDECHASNPGKYPEGYKLGYKERNKEYVLILTLQILFLLIKIFKTFNSVRGELFAYTTQSSPFNAPCMAEPVTIYSQQHSIIDEHDHAHGVKVVPISDDYDDDEETSNELTEEEQWYGVTPITSNYTEFNDDEIELKYLLK